MKPWPNFYAASSEREQIVALRKTDAGTSPLHEAALEAGTVEGAFEPAGKFHLDCYEELRKSEPEKWPALASPT